MVMIWFYTRTSLVLIQPVILMKPERDLARNMLKQLKPSEMKAAEVTDHSVISSKDSIEDKTKLSVELR